MRLRIATIATALLVLTQPAIAYRREYSVTLNGHRKPKSEVCIYHGIKGDAFSIFFSDPDVTCLPADQILDFPPGLFNAFARHSEGYVSAYPDFTAFSDPPRPEQGYERLEIPIAQAGYIDFADQLKNLPQGDSLGVWLSPTPKTGCTYFPLVHGETEVLVPLNTVAIPLHLRGRIPIAVGEAVSPDAREHVQARFSAGDHTLIAWVDFDRKAAAGAEGILQAPDVFLTANGHRIKPIVPLFDPDATGTLLFFRDVPQGSVEIHVKGRMWQPARVVAQVGAGPTTVVMEALRLVATGAIHVGIVSDAGSPQTSPSGCGASFESPSPSAKLLACPPDAECKNANSGVARWISSSAVEFDGVVPGHYKILVRPPLAKPLTAEVDVRVGRLSTAAVKLDAFRFFGRVTVNGAPVAARLIFGSGEARADEIGEYVATLAADPLKGIVQVITCSGDRNLRFVPRELIRSNSRYDLALDVAPLTVHVKDSRGESVAAADVFFGTLRTREPQSFFYTSVRRQTSAGGEVSFDDVPSGEEIVVCAHHQGFIDSCHTPMRLNADPSSPVTVQLGNSPIHGRVSGHTGEGQLTFVTQGGAITERVTLTSDGDFSLASNHGPLEHIVYASSSNPLTVIRVPGEWATGSAEVLLSVPLAARLSFVVALDRSDLSGYIGLWIGNDYIPLEALAVHQDFRSRDVRIEKGHELEIVDISQTAPISVAFAPDSSTKGPFVDPFTLPQYAGIRRTQVLSPRVVLSPR